MIRETQNTILFCWNDNEFIENFIIKSNKSKQLSKNLKFKLFTSPETLNKYIHENKSKSETNINGIVILCELLWQFEQAVDTNAYISYHGIELAKQLREKNLLCPIIFVSYLSQKQIFDTVTRLKLSENFSIMVSAKQKDGFLQLPAKPSDFIQLMKSLPILNQFDVDYIKWQHCNPINILKIIKHNLSSEKDTDKFIHSSQSFITIYQKYFPYTTNKAKIQISNLIKKYTNEQKKELCSIFEKMISTAENIDINIYGNNNIEKPAWKILFLDDKLDSDDIKLFINDLCKHVEINCFENSKDAYNSLNEDLRKGGFINVIITDHLLKTINGSKVEVEQDIQGYEFINMATELGLPYSFFVVSQLPRRFLLHSSKLFKTKPEVFHKGDLKSAEFRQYIIEKIIEAGNEIFEARYRLAQIPHEWFSNYYIKHRLNPDYDDLEHKINKETKFCMSRIEKNFQNGNILNKNYKVSVPQSIHSNLNTKPTEKKQQAFRNKLIARRIALWLHAKKSRRRYQNW